MAVACGVPSDEKPDTSTTAQKAQRGSTQAQPGGLTIPLDTSPAEFPILARDGIQLGSGARIESDSVLPHALNTTAGSIRIAPGAQLGSVESAGPVVVLPGARVSGDIRSGSKVSVLPGAHVAGDVEGDVALDPTEPLPLEVELPDSFESPVVVLPGSRRALEPGAYQRVEVLPKGELVLTPGTYHVESFTVRTGARLSVEVDAEGEEPTVLFAHESFTFRGSMTDESAAHGFLAVALGEADAVVGGPFRGTLVAPRARIRVGKPHSHHEGAFLGREVDVQPGVHIRHSPFPWERWLGPRERSWDDAPVILEASLDDDGTRHDDQREVPEGVSFTIPESLRVTLGNAGEGRVELRYRDLSGELVTCSYVGTAVLDEPDSIDHHVAWAMGLRYHFEACDNGLAAGDSDVGTWFRLEVHSGAPLGVSVGVETHLGDGCSAPLDDPIDPVQSAQLASSFRWHDTSPVPEVDPDGHPSLYYAWIYLETKEQVRGLDRMGVHWSAQPLFASDMSVYSGQCGVLQYEGDGRGLFVYAVMPGALYNFLRSAAIDALDNGKQMPFRAIHLPDRPDVGSDSVWNADGSLSWDSLRDELFILRPGRSDLGETQSPLLHGWTKKNIIDPAIGVGETLVDAGLDVVGMVTDAGAAGLTGIGGIAETIVGYAGKLDVLWELGAGILDEVWTEFTKFVGAVDMFFAGSVEVSLDFDITHRDPQFPRDAPMFRGWGPDRGSEIAPEGSRVFVKQWSVSFAGVWPATFRGRMARDGRMAVKVAKNNSPRGESGVCVELKNDYGRMSTFLLPVEVCDFRNLKFLGFRRDSFNHVRTRDYRLSGLTQVTDGGQYLEQVVGHSPHSADIGLGTGANMMTSFNNGAPIAPCLDFPGVSTVAIQAIGDALGPAVGVPLLGFLSASLIQRDIFLSNTNAPASRNARNSRGVMVHEYGHFAMCSIMFEQNSRSLASLVRRLREGDPDSRRDFLTLDLESIADLFASQVAGGTNYLAFGDDTTGFTALTNNAMSYCFEPPCVERNFRGVGDTELVNEFHDELAKIVTTLIDGFDGPGRHGTLAPPNGDLWERLAESQPLLPSAGYLPVDGLDDERVALSGPDFKVLVRRWAELSNIPADGGVHVVAQLIPALHNIMQERGYDWCDRCDVFALHSAHPLARTAQTQSREHRATRQLICRDEGLVGPPPEPSLRLDSETCQACDDGFVSFLGTCVPCPADQIVVGNTCQECPAGSVASGDRTECISCGSKAVAVGGECQPCGIDRGADHATATCLPCPANVVVDLASVADQAAIRLSFDTDDHDVANDVCPEEFWIEIVNLSAFVTSPRQYPTLTVTVLPSPAPATEEECASQWSDLTALLADGDRWVVHDQHLGGGHWCEPHDEEFVCVAPGCSAAVEHVWTRQELGVQAFGPNRVRHLVRRVEFGNVVGRKTVELTALAEGRPVL